MNYPHTRLARYSDNDADIFSLLRSFQLEWDNAGVADATDISDLCPGDLSMAETLEELHVGLNDANDKNANDFESTQCDCVDTIKGK